MPSFKTPTPQQIEIAVQRMRLPEFAAYFLSRLQNPRWIGPLRDRGLFASPPPAIAVESGGVRYPSWPASRYLARMATHAPSEVAAILRGLETDNASVVGDILDAALVMPADTAAALVPAVCRAAEAGTLWVYSKDASDLCVRLANGGEVAAALTLAEALFAPKFEQGQEEPSRWDEYLYEEGLQEVVPALAVRQAHRFITDLCDWLKASVEAKRYFDPGSQSDYSYLWRPTIEEHEQNRNYDFAAMMVGFVREGFEQALRHGQMTLDEALIILDQYQYLVFQRLRLHLINECAEENLELARQAMMNRALFEDYKFKHEYAMLIGRCLGLLTPEERETWFGWVKAGPDMSDFDEFVKWNQGREATDEDRQRRIQYWQFEKLHWVREHLEGSWREFYEGMRAQYGEPELADLNVRIGPVRCGHESPMTLDDLTHMTFEQAVETISSWKPVESQLMGPDIEGLASTFCEYVATDPEAFSRQASVMIGRPAIYVRGFINKMAEAAKEGRDIDIHAILALCRWVVEQPQAERTTPAREHGKLVDNEWQWTRDEVSRFVEKTCAAMVDRAPRYPLEGVRELMWALVSALCRDRAESYVVHDISEDDPRTYDYFLLGINSPRGKAVEAGLEYAYWVANHTKVLEGEQEVVPGGFDAMPEVRAMLEWQIDPKNRSFEALSIVGSRVGLIYWIDKAWLEKNANLIFNLEGIERHPPIAHGWSAWNSFLVRVRPHIEFYKLFREQFAYAVRQAARVQSSEKSHEQPMNHLAEHLIILYGQEQLSLDDDDGLLRRFLFESVPSIRRHAVGFVGRSLMGDERVPQEVIERFQTLWEVYWAGVGKADAAEKPDAWLFGPWFACGQFPEQWSLERLEQFVEVVPTPEPDYAVAKQLATIAQIDIIRSVRILGRMTRGDREGWRVHGWLDATRQILKKAMDADGSARTEAVQLIDYLGRRGFADFGALLVNKEHATD